jgi:hypothetical protein
MANWHANWKYLPVPMSMKMIFVPASIATLPSTPATGFISNMFNRILIYSIQDLAIDYEGIAVELTKVCRSHPDIYRISGVCQSRDKVYFPIETTNMQVEPTYILAPFSGMSDAQVEADLFIRWSGGFNTKGLIKMTESYLGLFESFN